MSKNEPKPVELKGWFRHRSHRYEFFATDVEVQRFFLIELPEKYAPYSWLVRTRRDIGPAEYVEELHEYSCSELVRLVEEHNIEIYLRSQVLTPDLNQARALYVSERPNDVQFQLRCAGLIYVQAHLRGAGSWDFCINHELRHEPGGTIHGRKDYLPLFNLMKRIIRKKLVVWGAYDYGSVKQEWKKPMLTAGFAAALREGHLKSKMVILDVEACKPE